MTTFQIKYPPHHDINEILLKVHGVKHHTPLRRNIYVVIMTIFVVFVLFFSNCTYTYLLLIEMKKHPDFPGFLLQNIYISTCMTPNQTYKLWQMSLVNNHFIFYFRGEGGWVFFNLFLSSYFIKKK